MELTKKKAAVDGRRRNPILELLDFAGSRKKHAIAGVVLAAASGVIAMVPYVLVWFVVREFVAVAPHWENAGGVAAYAWAALAVSLAGIALYASALMLTHMAAFRVASNMRKRCLEHVAKAPMGFFDENSSGRLRRIIDSSAAQTENLIAHKLPDFAAAMTTPVAFLLTMMAFDPAMGTACLVPVLVSFFAMWWMMGRDVENGGRYFMGRYQAALVRMNEAATEYVRGIPVVKVFQQTVHSFKAFRAAIVEYREMATNYVEFCKAPQIVQLVAVNGTFAFLVPAGILLAARVGDFSSFLVDFLFYVVFSALTTSTMTKVLYSTEAVQVANDSLGRVNEVLSVVPQERVSREAAKRPMDSSLELKGASFTFPQGSGPAVDNVDLRVEPGSTVALVGQSGSGKTTLASLFPRFWDVNEGAVMVGRVNVRDIDPGVLMDTVAFVFQDDRLFKMSLRENVRIGRPSATDEDVEAAIRAARCDDIVAKLPAGIDTVIGAEGVFLSGGERQRIAIARAVLKDAPIVVLDEATAFADPDNEALIQKALARLCEGKTVLTIAHRLSTVVGVDQIHVMSNGRIVESGTHAQLLEEGGAYSRLWKEYQSSVSWRIEGGGSHVA